MTLDEVIALSKVELRIMVAELTGWKQIGILNDGVPYGIPPADWERPDDPPLTEIWFCSRCGRRFMIEKEER